MLHRLVMIRFKSFYFLHNTLDQLFSQSADFNTVTKKKKNILMCKQESKFKKNDYYNYIYINFLFTAFIKIQYIIYNRLTKNVGPVLQCPVSGVAREARVYQKSIIPRAPLAEGCQILITSILYILYMFFGGRQKGIVPLAPVMLATPLCPVKVLSALTISYLIYNCDIDANCSFKTGSQSRIIILFNN